jgi:hypothetical protein
VQPVKLVNNGFLSTNVVQSHLALKAVVIAARAQMKQLILELIPAQGAATTPYSPAIVLQHLDVLHP